MDEGRKDMTNAPEKLFATGSSTTGSWNHTPLPTKISPAQTEYTRTDVADARIAEIERSRDNWMLMVGNIAATIPLKDTIGATATLGDMLEYFKGNQARIEELEAALTSILQIPNSDAAQGIMKAFAEDALGEIK